MWEEKEAMTMIGRGLGKEIGLTCKMFERGVFLWHLLLIKAPVMTIPLLALLLCSAVVCSLGSAGILTSLCLQNM